MEWITEEIGLIVADYLQMLTQEVDSYLRSTHDLRPGSFNGVPELPKMVDVDSRAVRKARAADRPAVAELKATGRLIPNQGMHIHLIQLLEAQASCEIENSLRGGAVGIPHH